MLDVLFLLCLLAFKQLQELEEEKVFHKMFFLVANYEAENWLRHPWMDWSYDRFPRRWAAEWGEYYDRVFQ